METFFSFLEKRVDDCSSLLCVGLDPHISELKSPTPASALDFCLNLVKQTAPYAAAFKPNAAFFEVFGAEGWTALKQVIEAIDEESKRQGSLIPVVLDAKRGDIASTAEAYAKSAFESLGAHCITLSPYLGKDSIDPFLNYPEKGVFLLCKTSNAGSGDLQDISVVGADRSAIRPYRYMIHVAKLAQSWNTKNNIGLVVGATHVEAMKRIRAAAPDLVVPRTRSWCPRWRIGNRIKSGPAGRRQRDAHPHLTRNLEGRESKVSRGRDTRLDTRVFVHR